jgi:hypothetical protein
MVNDRWGRPFLDNVDGVRRHRDLEFEEKMAQILCVYKEVEVLKAAAAGSKEPSDAVAIISYDEKSGVQAIGATAPDLPPKPDNRATFSRDHEYTSATAR